MSARRESEADRLRLLAGALGRIPSGLFVVTVRHGAAETGLLISWVQQCSFDPPQVSVCLRRDRPVNAWLTPGAAFTLNVLESGQTDMIVHFGRGFDLDEPAFEGLEVERPGGAPPVLPDVLAYLECRVENRFAAGRHHPVGGRVGGGRRRRAGQPPGPRP